MVNNHDTEGGEALIHLRVPAATKARWVRQSRADGMKLTDWITNRVEAQKMTVYKINDTLASKYHGSGHALVAVTGGQVVDLVYLKDVLPDFEPDRLQTAINDERLAPTVRRLQVLGDLSIGMLSCWEFVKL